MKNVFKLLLSITILTSSCESNKLEIDVSNSNASLSFKHYEQVLFATERAEIPSKLDQWAKDYPPFVGGDYKNPASIQGLNKYLDNDLNKKLWADWPEKIGNYDQIHSDLTSVFKHYEHYYPQDSLPTIYTYISGINYEQPITSIPNGIIIGIDMFYGADYLPYRNQQIPGFISKNNRTDFIAPAVMRHFAKQKFKHSLSGQTMLDNMIGLGKVEYFIQAMMPSMEDSLRFQFTPKQMDWCYAHEASFWKHLTMKDLIFSKDFHSYKKYLQPGPFVSSHERDSPGRAGIFIGYQIVKSYMDRNSDVSLNELMTDSDFNKIFSASKYKP